MGERVNCQINHTTTGKRFCTNEFPHSMFLSLRPHWSQERSAKAMIAWHIIHSMFLTIPFSDIFPVEEIQDGKALNTVTNTLTGFKPTPYCSRGFNMAVAGWLGSLK